MIQLARCCLNLSYLRLFDCHKITNASVWVFYKNAGVKTVSLRLDIRKTSVTLNKSDVRHPMLNILLKSEDCDSSPFSAAD